MFWLNVQWLQDVQYVQRWGMCCMYCMFCIVLYSILLFCIGLCCVVLYGVVLYCVVLRCADSIHCGVGCRCDSIVQWFVCERPNLQFSDGRAIGSLPSTRKWPALSKSGTDTHRSCIHPRWTWGEGIRIWIRFHSSDIFKGFCRFGIIPDTSIIICYCGGLCLVLYPLRSIQNRPKVLLGILEIQLGYVVGDRDSFVFGDFRIPFQNSWSNRSKSILKGCWGAWTKMKSM